jgi:uncharacterized protein YbjT (DUF2867 family)
MKLFIIGVAGGVGRLLAEKLIAAGDEPTGLVRREGQAQLLASSGIETTKGDLVEMSVEELAAAMRGCDAIVFSAGSGGKDSDEATTRVDGDGPGKLAEAAKVAGIRRFVLVSIFPEAWRDRPMDGSFEHYMAGKQFEHYMVQKKRAETQLVLTDLDWLILRPAALTSDRGAGKVDLGLAKVHVEIARDDVAATIAALLRAPGLNRLILEVTRGDTAISEAIDALSVATGRWRGKSMHEPSA